jgi:hypothetical protein
MSNRIDNTVRNQRGRIVSAGEAANMQMQRRLAGK